MSEIITRHFKKVYRVEFIESERGFGQKRECEDYDSKEEALLAVDRCNSFNKLGPAPDWYMVARYVGEVEVEV